MDADVPRSPVPRRSQLRELTNTAWPSPSKSKSGACPSTPTRKSTLGPALSSPAFFKSLTPTSGEYSPRRQPRQKDASRQVLQEELDEALMSLARQEADMMQAATHGMELLGENQRLTLDLRQSEAKVTELDGLLQSEFERSAAANKNAEQMLDTANERIRNMEHKSAHVLEEAQAYEDEIKEMQIKLTQQKESSAKLLQASKNEGVSAADLLHEVESLHAEVNRLTALTVHQEKIIQGCVKESHQLGVTLSAANTRDNSATDTIAALQEELDQVHRDLQSQTSEWPERLREEEARRTAAEAECAVLEGQLAATVQHLEDHLQLQMVDAETRAFSPEDVYTIPDSPEKEVKDSPLDGELQMAAIVDAEHSAIVAQLQVQVDAAKSEAEKLAANLAARETEAERSRESADDAIVALRTSLHSARQEVTYRTAEVSSLQSRITEIIHRVRDRADAAEKAHDAATAEVERRRLEAQLNAASDELHEYASYTASLEDELADISMQSSELVQTIESMTRSGSQSSLSPMTVVADDTTVLLDNFVQELGDVEVELVDARQEVSKRRAAEKALREVLTATEVDLEDACDRTTTAVAEARDFESKLVSLESEHTESISALRILNTKLGKATSLQSRMQGALSSANKYLSDSQAEASTLQIEIDRLRIDLATAEEATSLAEDEVVALKIKLAAMSQQAHLAQERADAIAMQLDEVKESADANAAAWTVERQTLEDDSRTAIKTSNRIQNELAQSQAAESDSAKAVHRTSLELTELKGESNAIRFELEGTVSSLSLAKQEIEILQEQAAAVEAERDTHEGMCSTLESQLQNHVSAVQTARETAVSKTAELVALSDELQQCRSTIEALEDQLASASAEALSAEEKLAQLKHSAEAAASGSAVTIKTLTEEVEQQKQHAQDLQAQLVVATQSVRQCEGKVQELETDLVAAKDCAVDQALDLQAKEVHLKAQDDECTALRDQLQRVQAELVATQDQHSRLTQEADAMAVTCTELQTKLQSVASEVARLEAEKTEALHNAAHLAVELNATTANAEVTASRLQETEGRVDELEGSLEHVRAGLKDMSQQLECRKSEIGELAAERDTATKAVDRLTAQLADASAVESSVSSNLAAARAACTEHELAVETAQRRISDLEAEHETLQMTCATHEEDIKAAYSELQTTEAKNYALSGKLHHAVGICEGATDRQSEIEEMYSAQLDELRLQNAEATAARDLNQEHLNTATTKLAAVSADWAAEQDYVSHLTAELASSTAQESGLEDDVRAANTRLDQLQALFTSSQVECAELQMAVETKSEQVSDLVIALDAEQQGRTAAEECHADAVAARDEFEKQLEASTRIILQLQEDLDSRASEAASRSIDLAAQYEITNELKDALDLAIRQKGEAEVAAMDLHAKVERISEEIRATKTEADSVALTLASTDAVRIEITSQLSSANTRCSELNAALVQTRSLLESSEATRAQSEQHVCELDQSLAATIEEGQSISVALSTTTAELNDRVVDLVAARGQVEALTAQLEDEKEAIEATHARAASSANSANARYTDLVAERNDLNKRLSEMNDTCTELYARLDDETAKVVTLEAAIATAAEQCNKLQRALDDTRTRADRIQEDLAVRTSELDAQDEDLEVQKNLAEALQDDFDEQRQHVRMLEVALLEVQVKSDAFAKRLDQKQSENDDLGHRLHHTESGLDELADQMQETIHFANALKRELSDATAAKKTLEEQVNTQALQLQAANYRIETITFEMTTSVDDAASLSTALSITTSELTEQIEVLSGTREELEDVRHDLERLKQQRDENVRLHTKTVAILQSSSLALATEQNRTVALVTDLSEERIRADTLQAQLRATMEERSELATALEATELTVDAVADDLNQRTLDVQSQMEQLAAMSVEMTTLQLDLQSALQTSSLADTSLKTAGEEIGTLRTELDARTAELKASATQCEKIMAAVSDLEEQLVDSTKSNSAHAARIAEMAQAHENAIGKLSCERDETTAAASETQLALGASLSDVREILAQRTMELVEASARCDSLNTHVENLKGQLAASAESKASSEDQHARALAEIVTKREAASAASGAVHASLESTVSALRDELTTSRSDCEVASTRCDKLSAMVADLDCQLAASTETSSARAAQIADVQDQITEVESQRNVSLAELGAARKEAVASTVETQTALELVRTERAARLSELQSSTTRCDELRAAVLALECQLAASTASTSELVQQHNASLAELDNRHADAATAATETIAALDTALASTSEELAARSSELQTVSTQCSVLSVAVSDLEVNLEAAAKSNIARAAEITELTSVHGDAVAKLALEREETLAVAAQSQSTQEMTLSTVQAALETCTVELTESLLQCDKLTMIVSDLEARLATSTTADAAHVEHIADMMCDHQSEVDVLVRTRDEAALAVLVVCEAKSALESTLCNVRDELALRTSAVAAAHTAHSSLESDMSTVQIELAGRTSELQEASTLCDELRATVSSLEGQLAASTEANMARATQIAQGEHQIVEQTAMMAEMAREHEVATSFAAEEQAMFEKVLSTVRFELATQTRHLQMATSQCVDLRSEVSELYAFLDTVNAQHVAQTVEAEKQVVNMEQQRKEAAHKYEGAATTAAAVHTSFTESLTAAQGEINDLQTTLTTRTTELSAASTRCTELLASVATLEGHSVTSTASNNASVAKIEELEEQIIEADHLQRATVDELYRGRVETTRLTSAMRSSFESTLSAMQSDLDSQTGELAAYINECDDLREYVSELEAQLIDSGEFVLDLERRLVGSISIDTVHVARINELEAHDIATKQLHSKVLAEAAHEHDTAMTAADADLMSLRTSLNMARKKIGDLLTDFNARAFELQASTLKCERLSATVVERDVQMATLTATTESTIQELKEQLATEVRKRSQLHRSALAESAEAQDRATAAATTAATTIAALETMVSIVTGELETRTAEFKFTDRQCTELALKLCTVEGHVLTERSRFSKAKRTTQEPKLIRERNELAMKSEERYESLATTMSTFLAELTARTNEVETASARCDKLTSQVTTYAATELAQTTQIAELRCDCAIQSSCIQAMQAEHSDAVGNLVQERENALAKAARTQLSLESELTAMGSALAARAKDLRKSTVRCANLGATITDLEARLETSMQSDTTRAAQVFELEQARGHAATEQHQERNNAVLAASETRASLQSITSAVREKLAKREAELGEMSSRCDEYAAIMSVLENQCAASMSSNVALVAELDEARKLVAVMDQVHNNARTQHHRELGNAEDTAAEAHAELANTLSTEVATRDAELKMALTRCDDLSTAVSYLGAQLTASTEANTVRSSRIDTVEKQVVDMKQAHSAEIAELVRAHDEVDEEKSSLQTVLESTRDALAERTSELQSASARCFELAVSISSLTASNDAHVAHIAETRLAHTTEVADHLRVHDEAMTLTLATHSSLVNTVQKDLATRSSELRVATTRCNELSTAAAYLGSQLNASTVSNTTHAERTKEVEGQIAEEKKAHAAALHTLATEKENVAAEASKTASELLSVRDELALRKSDLHAAASRCDELTAVVSDLEVKLEDSIASDMAYVEQIADMEETHTETVTALSREYNATKAADRETQAELEAALSSVRNELVARTSEAQSASARCDELIGTVSDLEDELAISAESDSAYVARITATKMHFTEMMEVHESAFVELINDHDESAALAAASQSSLEGVLSSVRDELATRTLELHDATYQYDELLCTVADLESHLCFSREATALSEEEIEELQAHIETQEQSHKAAVWKLVCAIDAAAMSAFETEVSLETSLSTAQDELDAQTFALQASTSLNSDLVDTLSDLESTLTASNALLASRLREAHKLIAVMDEVHANAHAKRQRESTGAAWMRASAETTLASVRQRLSTRTAELEASTVLCEALMTTVQDLGEELSDSEASNATHIARVNDMERQIVAIEDDYKDAVVVLRRARDVATLSATEAKSALDTTLDLTNTIIVRLNTDLEAAQTVSRELKSEVAASMDKANALSTELAVQVQALAELSTQMEATELKAVQRDEEIKSLTAKYDAAVEDSVESKRERECTLGHVTAERAAAAELQRSLEQVDCNLGEAQAEVLQLQSALRRSEEDVTLLASALAAASGEASTVKDTFAVHLTATHRISQQGAARIETLTSEGSFHRNRAESLSSELSASEAEVIDLREKEAAAILDRRQHYNRRMATADAARAGLPALNQLRWRMRTMSGGVEAAGLHAITRVPHQSEQRRCRELWGAFFRRPLPALPAPEEPLPVPEEEELAHQF